MTGVRMPVLTTEQKLEAVQALVGPFGVELKMRAPGGWYVSLRLDIGGDGFLSSAAYNGTTPFAAIDQMWREITNLPEGKYLVVRVADAGERRVRWNGFMWQDVPRTINRELP
jgi:hypothetical protein